MRFPVALVAALSIGATAHAQSAPAQSAPAQSAPAMGPSARINDIQVSREGEIVSILVKLSQQPAAATAKTSDETLSIDIEGVALVPLALSPPPGSLVTKVDTAANRLTLSGAAFGSATTVIYRNAVLIEAKLAEPDLRGSSLMTPALITPVAAPKPAAPEATPIQPVAIKSAPAPIPPLLKNDLESHPSSAAVAPPKPAAAVSTAALAGIDAARCTAAAAELAKDAWALAAMGDHALCLLDAGKTDDAKNRLDQLAAITPQDWRVALGRAALDEKAGDAVKAQAGFVAASLAAPNDRIRAAIAVHAPFAKAGAKAEVPLQLPMPRAQTAAAH